MAGKSATKKPRELPKVDEVLRKLRSFGSPENVEGMARFGINSKNTLGVSMPNIRKVARETGKDHSLAQELWDSGIHEARILASMVDKPGMVTEKQMEEWAVGFDSWDVCDNVCGGLFDRTPFAYRKAAEWTRRSEEFVKRAGFALIAYLAVHDKKASDKEFTKFLPLIVRESSDVRNFVKKAVNWALRQIGKRNLKLNAAAVKTAGEIQEIGSRAGRWVASDALRELTSSEVLGKLRARAESLESADRGMS